MSDRQLIRAYLGVPHMTFSGVLPGVFYFKGSQQDLLEANWWVGSQIGKVTALTKSFL
jgi:hypothetical protein